MAKTVTQYKDETGQVVRVGDWVERWTWENGEPIHFKDEPGHIAGYKKVRVNLPGRFLVNGIYRDRNGNMLRLAGAPDHLASWCSKATAPSREQAR